MTVETTVHDVDLLDPALFERGAFWDVFARLRRDAPIFRHPEPDGPGFWVLSRHRDIMSVYADQVSFSSRRGMRLDSDPDAVAAVAQRMLIVSDAPDHTHLKRVLQQSFSASRMPLVEGLVRQVIGDVLAEAADHGETDFIDVAKLIPNRVVCALMGIPRSDWEWIGQITTDAFEGDDETVRSGAHGEIFLYFTDLLAERRRAPGDDIVSAIFTATADLVSAFPAVGAREAGLVNTALLCAQEIPVPGSQPRCIRALVHAYVKAGQPVRHVYLREAAALRPDWAGAASGGSASGKPSAAGA